MNVLLGDFINVAGLSGWNRRRYLTQADEDIQDDFDSANKLLDSISQLGAKKNILLQGNHEWWLDDFVDEHPSLKKKLDIRTNLKLKERDIEYITVKKQRTHPFRIGKLCYIHGWYASVHHTKKTGWESKHNVIYGHTHDVQVFTRKEISDGGARILTQSIGCLCKEVAFDYLRTPCNWMLAFGVTYVDKDGSFTHYTIPIPQYKFIWNGKVYKN